VDERALSSAGQSIEGVGTTRVSSARVLRRRDVAFFGILASVNLAAVAFFLDYWVARPVWATAPAVYAIVTLLLLVVAVNYAGRWLMLPLMQRPISLAIRSHPRVGIATTFVPSAEDLEMLEQSVSAMVAIDYPHDTWVLDEADDSRVAELCHRLGARHFSRKHMPHYQTDHGRFRAHTKYGNVNAWLSEHGFDRYDIVTLFDPDHVPSPTFLERVLGFFEDPGVGYVQAAQAYYNQSASFIARGAAEETYAYNSSIQMAAFGMGYPIIVGCHNTHRIAALRGGEGLSPHDADDLLTTLAYRSRGWRGVFVPEILARGLTPVDWPGYLSQQRRWARSVIDVKVRYQSKLAAGLSPAARTMSLLQGLNYLYRSFTLFAAFLVLVFTLATGIGASIVSHLLSPQLVLVWTALFATDLFRQRFYLDRPTECGLHWRVAVLHLAKWPYMLLALADVALRRQLPYTITPKAGSSAWRAQLVVPHLIALAVLVIAWASGLVAGLALPWKVHAVAAACVVGSLAFVLSTRLPFPDPYDRSHRASI